MAAAMGADEYGFGSLAMIATGCAMARICHTNNCRVGVAIQREELRARFPGVPGDLINYFLYVAEEVRGILAQLGYNKLDEIIGRTELLRPRDISLVKRRIEKKYGDTGFAGKVNLTFLGSAGQTFACFLILGMNIRLIGEPNDYVGKVN